MVNSNEYRFGVAIFVFILVSVSDALNLGLIAGDLKRFSSPLVIKKISKLSPVFITINSGPKVKRELPLKLTKLDAFKPTKKLPRSILSPLLPPLVPKLPLIPFLPTLPILPPLLPKPLLPIIPPLIPKSPLKPLKIPILNTPKSLASELKPLKIPILKEDSSDLLKKLLDLKIKGSLTTSEYLKIRKLLNK